MIRSLLLCLLLANALPALELLGVDYSEQDKQGHAVLGAASAGIAMLTLDALVDEPPWYARAAVGIAAATLVGIGKEMADSGDPAHHCVEKDDAVATITGGAVVAITLCWRF